MADHFLYLTGIDGGYAEWDFACNHSDADRKWWPTNPDGTPIYTIDGDECSYCWLWSWWDGLGNELIGNIALPKGVTFPLPVRPSDDWNYDNGGTIVMDEEARRG